MAMLDILALVVKEECEKLAAVLSLKCRGAAEGIRSRPV